MKDFDKKPPGNERLFVAKAGWQILARHDGSFEIRGWYNESSKQIGHSAGRNPRSHPN
ncbi:MAG: hypothetical protein M0T70_13405 [Geobacteraceae bacterium]|nr:hypothetical protein [Geobacteraceae bacterium]